MTNKCPMGSCDKYRLEIIVQDGKDTYYDTCISTKSYEFQSPIKINNKPYILCKYVATKKGKEK